jgi:hypothetical protein
MSKTRNLSLLAGAAVTLGAFGNAYAVEGQAYTSADEVRAIVANMMADADTRSSMMLQGGGGGYDDGFYLADSGGNFRLNIRGLVQFRYVLNFQDEDDGEAFDEFGDPIDLDDADFESGFQNARTRIGFDGYVIDPNLFYNVELLASDPATGGSFNLQRAYVGYRWDNGFHLKWGQFRLQFLREENVNPEYQLAGDRSLTNEVFAQGDVQGIELGYSAEDFRIYAAFTDGFNSANTDVGTNTMAVAAFDGAGDLIALSPAIGNRFTGEADIAITARGEIRFAGTWDQFEDFTSMPGSEYGVMLGIAGHYQWTDQDRVGGGAIGGDASVFSWTADISVEGDGWNFFIAGMGSWSDLEDVTVNTATGDTSDLDPNDYGLVIQGGIFIPETDWEFFARYDVTFFDDDERDLGEDTFNVITAGVNWYWSGHAAKFTLDVQWFIDDDHPIFPGGNSQINYFGPQDDEFNIRAQFQLMF